MQQAHNVGHFGILRHGKANTHASVHCRQSGPDDGNSHSRGDHKHEGETVPIQESITNLDGHIANWGAGSGGGGNTFQGAIHGDQFVAQSIVGSEILKEVSEQALNNESQNHSTRDILFRVLGFSGEGSGDLKPTKIRIAIVD